MLRIKYFEEFINAEPFLVIISDKDGLKKAYNFFKDKDGAFLNDSSIAEYCDISPLDEKNLYLNSTECKEIAQHFKNLYDADNSGHTYFDIEALPDALEIIISYQEYDNLF